MAAKPSLLDLISQDIDAPRKNSRFRWVRDLPDGVREQVEEAKRRWQAGELKLTGNRMALKIIAALPAMGVQNPPGRTTVQDWLRG